MPNWVFNSLAISGEPEQVAQAKFQLNQPYTRKYDEWNEELKVYEMVEATHNNPVFAFWNIASPVDLDTYYSKDEDTVGPKGVFWNIENWGVKWDVAVKDNDEFPDTEIINEDLDLVTYKFNTAWSVALPAIQELSRQYPELVVDLEYEEETGWGGEITFKNGEVIEQAEYDNRCPDCDDYDVMEWNEEDGTEKCKECGYEC